jgi:F420-dependent oxidoreductase-like protein
MRFGFKTAPENSSWEDILAIWRAADEMEVFESGWNFDHFYSIYIGEEGDCFEAWTMLGALAQATRRLRLGALVTGMHYRHPAVLANMAATLDIISGGRLEIGLGAGWNEPESTAYGIELGSVKDRLDRFEEGVQVIIGLLENDRFSFDGRFYTITNARCNPKAIQRPHPTICMGGSGEKRTLRTVAKFADHWNFSYGEPTDFEHKRDVLYAHCADVGRDPKDIMLSAHVPYDGDPKSTAATAAAFGEAGADLSIIYLHAPYSVGVLEGVADALAQYA